MRIIRLLGTLALTGTCMLAMAVAVAVFALFGLYLLLQVGWWVQLQ